MYFQIIVEYNNHRYRINVDYNDYVYAAKYTLAYKQTTKNGMIYYDWLLSNYINNSLDCRHYYDFVITIATYLIGRCGLNNMKYFCIQDSKNNTNCFKVFDWNQSYYFCFTKNQMGQAYYRNFLLSCDKAHITNLHGCGVYFDLSNYIFQVDKYF